MRSGRVTTARPRGDSTLRTGWMPAEKGRQRRARACKKEMQGCGSSWSEPGLPFVFNFFVAVGEEAHRVSVYILMHEKTRNQPQQNTLPDCAPTAEFREADVSLSDCSADNLPCRRSDEGLALLKHAARRVAVCTQAGEDAVNGVGRCFSCDSACVPFTSHHTREKAPSLVRSERCLV
jgi:hypothetical protein